MRVAIIDPSGFTPPYDHCLADALTQQGCQVVLVTTRMPPVPWVQEATYERWEHFYRIASRLTKAKIRAYLKGCEHPFDMKRLLRRLRLWKPDIIHFQWVPIPVVDKPFLRRFHKIAPLVLTVHDTEPFHGTPSSRFQLIGLVSAFRQFDHYIVHTQYSKEVLVRQMALPEHCVTVIPHGVLAYYRALLSDLTRVEQQAKLKSKKRILFFGILKPYKGVDVLLEAFACLPESIAKDTVLQIVGYPKMPIEPLQTLAKRLGIDKQVFWDLRFVEEEEVAVYFAQADVVVLPYRRIDQSGVLMIALAFGKPIVASKVGGFAEIIKDGIHGFLVDPGDAKSFARALARVLGDDQLRAQMASAVEKSVGNELSWNTIAKETIQLYQKLLRTRSQKSE